MATIFFQYNGMICLDSISSEEDLKLKPQLYINPPPADGKCQCCKRHISTIKPFEIEDIPEYHQRNSVGFLKQLDIFDGIDLASDASDLEGALLIKMFRLDPIDRASIVKSWECRDCAVLDENEYFDRLFKRLSEQARAE